MSQTQIKDERTKQQQKRWNSIIQCITCECVRASSALCYKLGYALESHTRIQSTKLHGKKIVQAFLLFEALHNLKEIQFQIVQMVKKRLAAYKYSNNMAAIRSVTQCNIDAM